MDNVTMQPVVSSNIAQVGYEQETKHLYVEFNNGTVYRYLDVNEEVYEQLVNAASVGKFLNAEIKPNHNYERVA